MGTRGLTAVIQNGTHKVAQYGQWDHYPEGQGLTALRQISDPEIVEGLRAASTRFITDEEHAALWESVIPGSGSSPFVTMEQSDQFKAVHPQFSRDNGAKILGMVAQAEGEMSLVDQIGFAKDSLFCEYAYVVDLDENTFEVYKGFQREPHTEGRFASDTPDDGYYPVRLIASWPLDALPTEEDFLAATTEEDEEEEE